MRHTKHGRLRRKCNVAGQQCRNTEGLKWNVHSVSKKVIKNLRMTFLTGATYK